MTARWMSGAEQGHSGIGLEENREGFTEEVAPPCYYTRVEKPFHWKQCPEESQRNTDHSVLRNVQAKTQVARKSLEGRAKSIV